MTSISHVQFGLLSSDEVRQLSEVEVTETALYDRNIPRDNAVNDLRLGTVDRRFCCNTCKKSVMECVGHTGHIELALPVYHVGYIDLIVKVLRSVCHFCSRLLTTNVEGGARQAGDSINSVRQHLTAIANSGKLKKGCAHCGCPQPNYMRMGLAIKKEFCPKVVFETDKEKEFALRPFTTAEALNILHHISDEDLRLLGFSERPENMIISNLLVPPPIMRPTIMVSDGSRIRGQDDLTLKLQDILKQNRVLKKDMSDRNAENVIKAHEMLQLHVALYMNHDSRTFHNIQPKGSVRTSGQLRSIFFRLKGKKGRVRGNLMGKRCDFTSRSVITPDPYMPIDYIGVPEVMALKQTVAEIVNPYNISRLRKAVQIGSGKLGGAHAVCQGDENLFLGMFDTERLDKITLRPGDVVERYLVNEDWVMFNRQPSLHKQSIMGHRVKIIPGNTFRLPVCDTSPYNADFDGDEMNMHVCQTGAANVEIREIMAVPKQIISPQSNKPIIGLVQDPVIGAYLMTQRAVVLTKLQMMDALSLLEGAARLPPPAIVHPAPLWTGKQAFDMLFLPRLQFRRKVRQGQDDDITSWLERFVLVQDGQLLAGAMCKQSLGSSSGGLVHVLHKDYGGDEAARLIVNVQRVVNRWLEGAGFSIGIGDCYISPKTQLHIKHILRQLLQYIEQLNRKKGSTSKELLEAQTSKVLQSIINQTGKAALQHMDPRNSIFCAVTSGSKGTPINISQIMACVGQQSVEGKRINVQRGKLSCYTQRDAGKPKMHGFVHHSYFAGLSPTEYYFHAMGGREGLVDTAVKTAATGYISRRLVKVMESIAVQPDLTIRTSTQEIVQFQYGGDDYDATYLETIGTPYMFHSSRALQRHTALTALPTHWTRTQRTRWQEHARRDAARQVDLLKQLQTCMAIGMAPLDDISHFPVNLQRQMALRFASSKEPLAYYAPCADVEAMLARLDLTTGFELHIRHWLCPASLLQRGITRDELLRLCADVERVVVQARVAQGEMVGAIASSSIGEPCTQMTLNTFHSAGIATKNVTLGIPRFKELIDVSKNIKTPSVTIYLNSPMASSQALASMFATSIRYTMLDSIVEASQLLHEPDVWHTDIADDQVMLDLRRSTMEWQEELHAHELSSWVIRIVLDMTLTENAQLTMLHIERAIHRSIGDKVLQVVASDENACPRVLRIRMYNLEDHIGLQKVAQSEQERIYLEKIAMQQLQNHLLDSVYLQGLEHIQGAVPREIPTCYLDGDEGICTRNEWVVETTGTNLQSVLGMAGVDSTRTISNDVLEVYHTFGVEMANTVLFREIKHVLGFDGTYVNDRHVQLLVDTMTLRGFLCPVSRHGMAKSSLGPLMRSSFEETVDVLLDAGAYSECDRAKGVTENIMLGNLAPIGTGSIPLDCSHHMCQGFTESADSRRRTKRVAAQTNAPAAEQSAEQHAKEATPAPRRFVGRRPPPSKAAAALTVPPPVYQYVPTSPTLRKHMMHSVAYAPSSPRIIQL